MVTSQKEAFTGTVRVCGCQTWHSLRRPELDRNGAWGSWANGRHSAPTAHQGPFVLWAE